MMLPDLSTRDLNELAYFRRYGFPTRLALTREEMLVIEEADVAAHHRRRQREQRR